MLFIFETSMTKASGSVEPNIPESVFAWGSGAFIYSADKASVLCLFLVEDKAITKFNAALDGAKLLAPESVDCKKYPTFKATLEALQTVRPCL